MNTQFKKGLLEMCILKKLSEKDYYGYTIMQEMKLLFPDVNDSTFYSILRRLNAEKETEIYLGNESGGPTRKYYKLTDSGRRRLDEYVKDWEEMKDVVGQLDI